MLSLQKSSKICSYERSHFILLLVTFLYVMMNLFQPRLYIFSIIFVAGIFLFYTWRRILFILITSCIAFVLVCLFPALKIVAFILMVVIFLCRLGYILQNWRAVVAGFYMYGVGIEFADFARGHASSYGYIMSTSDSITNLVIAIIVTVIFHFIMSWLYAHGYTLKTAMPIMGVAPLLIMLLFLPFIKAFDGFDSPVDTTDGNIDTGNVGEVTHSGYHDNMIDNPGVHHTQAYDRMGPDGTIQHVRGYVATNPDGIIENNFSYHGTGHTDASMIDKSNIHANSTDSIREENIIGVNEQSNKNNSDKDKMKSNAD